MNGPGAGPEEPATTTPAGAPDGLVVSVFARTDVGLLREHNEDDFLVADMTNGRRALMPDVQSHSLGKGGSLFVVCDGMGGAAAGEVASRTAVDTIYERLTADGPPDGWDDLVGRLDRAIIEAGRRIFAMARADQERRGMGTTCTAATLIDGRLFVAQVGDSRCYALRGGVLTQLTRDQSLLTQLIEAGQVRPEDAPNFEHSNIILQALGTTEMVNTDVTFLDLRRGDAILLCSDGLSGMVCDATLREILVSNPEPLAACRALTEAANAGGGEDNITCVVARFDGATLPEPGSDDAIVFRRFAKPRPAQFDRVPYTIPDQKFADGGPAIPQAPEVPMGAVSVTGMGPAAVGPPPADMPGGWPAAPSPADAALHPAGPVATSFDGTGADLAEALRGAADAPRVIEWADEDVSLDDLPAQPPAEREQVAPQADPERSSLRGWGVVAVLLLALVVVLLVFESMRSSAGTAGADVVPAGSAEAGPPPPGPPPPSPAVVDQPAARAPKPLLRIRPERVRGGPLAQGVSPRIDPRPGAPSPPQASGRDPDAGAGP
ncbi:MAG: protein phosphatase 2C domain-containing protein [Deltaproteobacteria bacterium]|nr:protein phosphatase 2C domain-containing protein [Deltaproteobacteria bacterium]